MGAFDYNGLSSAQSAELARLSFSLAAQSMLSMNFAGISAAGALSTLESVVGTGTISGGAMPLSMPTGWSEISANDIGFTSAHVDSQGFIQLQSPITGWTESGPQLRLYAERGADGAISRVAISFAGTNSPLDVVDFLQLNDGKLAPTLEPLLSQLATFLQSQGLSGDDLVVTGYSLGGGMTNIMAAAADTLAGGFFADASYIGHASPVIFDGGDGRVLNIGFENDVVHRATGGATDFGAAVDQAGPFLSQPDRDFASSTDNMVIFDGAYSAANGLLAVDSILNPFSWWAHVGTIFSDPIDRITGSAFYDLTRQDSVIVVSNLGADKRGTVWVEDKASPTSNHFDAPAFIVGTAYGDLLRDGRGGDYLDGGAGNDTIWVRSGANTVDGGAGTDTLRLTANAGDLTAWRLGDGSLVLMNGDGLTLARNIEKVELHSPGIFGGSTTPYSIQSDRLEDDHWSFLQLGDRDIALARAVEGTGANDTLSGRAVFGMDGHDRLTGTADRDMLHGGGGNDTLTAGAGGDRMFGAEGDDLLIAGQDSRLNGSLGNDSFVFNAAARGAVVIEDFNQASGEADRISLTQFDDFASLRAAATQAGDAVQIDAGALTIRLEHTSLASLDAGDFLFV